LALLCFSFKHALNAPAQTHMTVETIVYSFKGYERRRAEAGYGLCRPCVRAAREEKLQRKRYSACT
jgi:hypothetical protein